PPPPPNLAGMQMQLEGAGPGQTASQPGLGTNPALAQSAQAAQSAAMNQPSGTAPQLAPIGTKQSQAAMNAVAVPPPHQGRRVTGGFAAVQVPSAQPQAAFDPLVGYVPPQPQLSQAPQPQVATSAAGLAEIPDNDP